MPASPPGETPARVQPKRLGAYLEVMSKAVFQSSMPWKVVESKWPELRLALRDFDTAAMAALTPKEIDALTQDRRVIRNRRKLEAIVSNAQRMLALEAEHGSFRKYLRSHDDFNATVDSLRSEFKFLRDMGSFYFLYVVGEGRAAARGVRDAAGQAEAASSQIPPTSDCDDFAVEREIQARHGAPRERAARRSEPIASRQIRDRLICARPASGRSRG
jgi:hypothetical protein